MQLKDAIGNDRMSINDTGEVGIGTNSPTALLEVASTTPYAFGTILKNEASEGHGLLVQGGGTAANRYIMQLKDGQGENQLTINGEGKVAIGSTDFSGSHKLRVEGSMSSREVKVQASGWYDFVFDNDYQLPTLEEVEQHIQEKGHLADIPSETEVLENGINLGEMNGKLLQKIEELTLYMIQQNKESQEQKKRLEEQSALINELQTEINKLKKTK